MLIMNRVEAVLVGAAAGCVVAVACGYLLDLAEGHGVEVFFFVVASVVFYMPVGALVGGLCGLAAHWLVERARSRRT